MDYHSIIEGFSQIPDESVRHVLVHALHVTVKQGYSGLFWSALVFSGLSLISAVILGSIRRKRAAKQHVVTHAPHQS